MSASWSRAEVWLADCGPEANARLEQAWPAGTAMIDRQLPSAGLAGPADGVRLASHVTLRLLLARHIGEDAALAPFDRGPLGKPHLAALPDVRFSLAHSGSMALIALSMEDEVGCDIEAPRRIHMNEDRRARLRVAGLTVARGDPLPDVGPDHGLIQAWVRLEAMAKATGEGMGRVLTRYGVAGTDADRARLVSAGAFAPGAEPFSLRDIEFGAGYVGAIAGTGSVMTAAVRQFPSSVAGMSSLLLWP